MKISQEVFYPNPRTVRTWNRNPRDPWRTIWTLSLLGKEELEAQRRE
jgi:hypothetical protein